MEIWDLYDNQGNKTGETWERSRAKEIPEGRYHIVCDILIRHQDGAFLLTLRDSHKDIYPGCWEASAGGSALAGETPEECARREMLEETGLKAEKLELISVNYRPQSHSVLYAYLSAVNCQKDAVRLQEGETVDYRWIAPGSFLSLIREEPILKMQYPRYKPYLDQLKEDCYTDNEKYIYKIASLEEMNQKWDYEIRQHPETENWTVWKSEAIEGFQSGGSIPYYGILDGTVICEATAVLHPDLPQDGFKAEKNAVELCAFRTIKEYQGKGYFSKLMDFMQKDLKQKGYTRAVVGVEPEEKLNKAIYHHWGFTEHIGIGTETYPDGTEIKVEFYGKQL